MSDTFQKTITHLDNNQHVWLVTGVAGFIGSHLLEFLLGHGQKVIGIDSFITGYQKNLDQIKEIVGEENYSNFTFHEVDIADMSAVEKVVTPEVEFVLHQAALGSVPRSIENPINTNRANVDGFLNVITAAKNSGVKSFVYASSSSVYGDSKTLPKVESEIGKPLSPYATSKYTNELYAAVFSPLYGMPTTGLRYFNVFGPRQDPDGPYAAVIPKWLQALCAGEPCLLYGDGTTSRDFTFVKNVVQANVLSALRVLNAPQEVATAEVFNVAVGESLTLKQLYSILAESVKEISGKDVPAEPQYRDFRAGDIKHSLAALEHITSVVGYSPTHFAREGLSETVKWFLETAKQ